MEQSAVASGDTAKQHSRDQARYSFTVQPLDSVMGAEITGIDVAEPFDDTVRDEIFDALLQHHILAFRDQDLTKDQQLAFTERLGEVEWHVARGYDGKKSPLVHTVSNLDKDGKPTKVPRSNGNFFWHTDKSYHDIPSLATMLHAKQLPPVGGSTQFANMYLAYETLPQEMKDRIADLRAVHSWEASRRNSFSPPATEEQKKERPPVSHPIVRTHPDTGRKLLYLGLHTSHIEGLPEGEGRALLYQLLDFASQPRFVHTHQWRMGDLIMWDNRCLVHRATGDFEMDKHPRVLHRTVIRGSVPY